MRILCRIYHVSNKCVRDSAFVTVRDQTNETASQINTYAALQRVTRIAYCAIIFAIYVFFYAATHYFIIKNISLFWHNHKFRPHTFRAIKIYIYIYILCVCVCLCRVCMKIHLRNFARNILVAMPIVMHTHTHTNSEMRWNHRPHNTRLACTGIE